MVSIVMPAYNEEDIIEPAVREWYEQVASRIPGAELLVVDDCSRDRTGAILERLQQELPGLRCLRPDRNGGHGRALLFGFAHATQDYVFQTDSDRQHLPADFWPLWEARASHDFVFGVRMTREDGPLRKIIATALRGVLFLLWGHRIADANCPFKLMRSDALAQVLRKIPPDAFIPMVMVSILARTMRFSVLEKPVRHLPRRGGTQSLQGLFRWISVGTRCTIQLLRLRFASYEK